MIMKQYDRFVLLTKYVVGANAKPPKNPSSPPKKGNVMATNMVNAANHQLKTELEKATITN